MTACIMLRVPLEQVRNNTTPEENNLQVKLLEQTCSHEIVPVGSAHPLALFRGTRIWRCQAWA
ncbi:hypothetical protein NTG1052_50049 [Candidatus Nitrotoga sp. 1052]|nr:hypothetical protein NTG1052_50049 [Candidatus Nitrotoga sp. 1052]